MLLDVGWVGSAREEQVGLPLQSAPIKPIGLFFFFQPVGIPRLNLQESEDASLDMLEHV